MSATSHIPEGIKRVAVFCILKCKDRFLLLKRAKEPNIGLFVPVGGKIDPFETPLQAVTRETFEETGIQITNPKYCGVLTETSPGKYNWVSFIYYAEIEDIPIPICDEGELDWVHRSELSSIPTPSTDRFIYQYVAIGMPFAFSATFDHDVQMIRMDEEIEGVCVFEMIDQPTTK